MFPQLAQELLLADEAVDNNHNFFCFFFFSFGACGECFGGAFEEEEHSNPSLKELFLRIPY